MQLKRVLGVLAGAAVVSAVAAASPALAGAAIATAAAVSVGRAWGYMPVQNAQCVNEKAEFLEVIGSYLQAKEEEQINPAQLKDDYCADRVAIDRANAFLRIKELNQFN